MSEPSPTYEPRRAAHGALYRVVVDHFETCRAEADRARDGRGLPRFIEQEFREFLQCGMLAGGFARFRCDDCGLNRLVPFSCKGRGFCPSCGGRRMAQRAAHLVDDVFPAVSVRQWVLTLPHRLPYWLAWDHHLCRAVVGVSVRTVLGFLRHVARLAGVVDGRSGAVAIVQRFGGALNLNVHMHALVIDGVFARDGAGVRFCSLPSLTAADVADVLATIVPRVRRLLERRGLGDTDEDASAPGGWTEDAPALAGIAAASVQGTFALGPRAGQRARQYGAVPDEDEAPAPGRCHARQDGFDLHADVWVPAHQRDRLERVCRYALRPPVAQDRLHAHPVRSPRTAGTPRRAHPAAADQFDSVSRRPWRRARRGPSTLLRTIPSHVEGWRELVVGLGQTADPGEAMARGTEASATGKRADPSEARSTDLEPGAPAMHDGAPPRPSARLWADLMRRTIGFDFLTCPRCGGRFRLIGLIEEAAVIQRILRHLHLPTEVPDPPPLVAARVERQALARPRQSALVSSARRRGRAPGGRRRSSMSARSTRTRTSPGSTRDRCAQVPPRRRYAGSSCGRWPDEPRALQVRRDPCECRANAIDNSAAP